MTQNPTPNAPAREERCETCAFSRRFVKPDPLPEPTTRCVFFGLFRTVEGPTPGQRLAHAVQTCTSENYVACCRFPKPKQQRPTHWCGEYQRREG